MLCNWGCITYGGGGAQTEKMPILILKKLNTRNPESHIAYTVLLWRLLRIYPSSENLILFRGKDCTFAPWKSVPDVAVPNWGTVVAERGKEGYFPHI